MRSINIIALAMLVCGFLATVHTRSGASEPTSQKAEKPDSDVVQWRLYCDLEDGRRFVTDGSLLLESRYLPKVPVPEKSLPPQAVHRLLQSETDHEFGLGDLERKGLGGNYIAPGGIQLNKKYIDNLRRSPLKSSLRFRAKGVNDPVLILDGKKIVGVMMPLKT